MSDALHINDHLFVNVCVSYDFAELFKVDFSVLVLVGEEDGLVHDLLELGVLQVGPNHHLKHLEQLTVTDVTVIVHIVDSANKQEETLGRVNSNLFAFYIQRSV